MNQGAPSVAIDNNFNVYAVGSTYDPVNSAIFFIKYSQDLPLKITKPLSDIKWMAGETDTVKWTGGKAGQFLEIAYSEDNGSTYNIIDIATPADSGYFIWNLPDNILTTKAKIKITDIVDPTIKAVSDSFRIKGYVLTRLDENNQYVAFSPAAHGWQFTNGTLWPQSWWNQFQYATGIDPNTNELYPSFFHPWVPSTFIDWPLWVEVFGVDQCYYWTSAPLLGPNYKGNAQRKWRDRGVITVDLVLVLPLQVFLLLILEISFSKNIPAYLMLITYSILILQTQFKRQLMDTLLINSESSH